ncbi:unnamed protein product [Urochloa humidicola]
MDHLPLQGVSASAPFLSFDEEDDHWKHDDPSLESLVRQAPQIAVRKRKIPREVAEPSSLETEELVVKPNDHPAPKPAPKESLVPPSTEQRAKEVVVDSSVAVHRRVWSQVPLRRNHEEWYLRS